MPRWSAFVPEIDRGLVKGLNDGEEDALAKLYDAYVEHVFDYAVSLTGEGKAAETLVHDVFIDAVRRAPRLRDRDRFRAWLYAAARRRGLARSRARGVAWDWGAPGAGKPGGLTVGEVREMLEGVLDRVSFGDQDLLLLTFRHGVAGADLAAVLGVSPFRAAALVGKAKARAEAALEAQLRVQEKRCVREQGGRPASDWPGHREKCVRCRRRAGVSLAVLLEAPPAPVPSPGLRHRVLHTGTDPELAGYRADISAKGGHLTPEGMPRQPDVPSPLRRRWLLAGSGMVATFAVALAASLLLGPQLGLPSLSWPPGPGRTESPVSARPTHTPRAPDGPGPLAVLPPGQAGPDGSAQSPPVEVEDDLPAPEVTQFGTPSPLSSPLPSPSPSAQQQGQQTVTVKPELKVESALVTVGADRTTQIQIRALNGPVTWQAVSDDARVSLDASSGALAAGEVFSLRVRLPLSLIRLAGSAVVSVVNVADGSQVQVTVRWGLSLL